MCVCDSQQTACLWLVNTKCESIGCLVGISRRSKDIAMLSAYLRIWSDTHIWWRGRATCIWVYLQVRNYSLKLHCRSTGLQEITTGKWKKHLNKSTVTPHESIHSTDLQKLHKCGPILNQLIIIPADDPNMAWRVSLGRHFINAKSFASRQVLTDLQW